MSALAACLFATTLTVTAKEKPPENWDGLERKKVKGLDNVYVRPNVQFTPYKSVILDKTAVEFSKNWEKSFDFHDRPAGEHDVAALLVERDDLEFHLVAAQGIEVLHRLRIDQ